MGELHAHWETIACALGELHARWETIAFNGSIVTPHCTN